MKFSIKYFSFTKNELKAILFMTLVLLSGLSIKYIKNLTSDNSFIFDYSESEETFKRLSGSSANLLTKDSSDRTGSGSSVTISDKLKSAEDSLKSTEKKKSKKEEKLKPKSININTATKEILIMLPGIGESTAEKIINYRETHNGFKKIEHIMKVKGIGKKKFEKLKEYITID